MTMSQSGIEEFSKGIKENEDNLIINLDPRSYLKYFLKRLKNYENIKDFREKEELLSLDRLILEEYISRFEEKEKITPKNISKVIEFEKDLINLCIDKVIEKRAELINYDVNKLNYNLGMVYALSDANNIKKRDIIYAAANEKFVHGTSTAFGFLREAESKAIKKKESNHIFGTTTANLNFEDKSSFDLILLIIEEKLVKEIIFIQMSSGPNCKNFSHAIQINNVKNWFKNTCEGSLTKLRAFVMKKEREEFDSLINELKELIVAEDRIKVIVGQAYGDEGMTASMMKSAKVDVIRGDDLWELITGIDGINPFKAEKVAGTIVLNIFKEKEPKETQKMSFWDMINHKMSLMEGDLELKDFSID